MTNFRKQLHPRKQDVFAQASEAIQEAAKHATMFLAMGNFECYLTFTRLIERWQDCKFKI